jgi:hypothetical protein
MAVWISIFSMALSIGVLFYVINLNKEDDTTKK